MILQEIEAKAKELTDLLVANGAIAPQAINPGVWMNLHVKPISYEGAYFVVLETLRNWSHMSDKLPDTAPMMTRNLDEYMIFMQRVDMLGRIANAAPVRLTRIEVPNASIGQWHGLPEKIKLWFIAHQNEPYITKATHDNFQLTFALVAEKFNVIEYKIGFRLEGQPGIIRNSEGKDIFLTHTNEPGMYLVVEIGAKDAERTEQSPGNSPGPIGEATPVG